MTFFDLDKASDNVTGNAKGNNEKEERENKLI